MGPVLWSELGVPFGVIKHRGQACFSLKFFTQSFEEISKAIGPDKSASKRKQVKLNEFVVLLVHNLKETFLS